MDLRDVLIQADRDHKADIESKKARSLDRIIQHLELNADTIRASIVAGRQTKTQVSIPPDEERASWEDTRLNTALSKHFGYGVRLDATGNFLVLECTGTDTTTHNRPLHFGNCVILPKIPKVINGGYHGMAMEWPKCVLE